MGAEEAVALFHAAEEVIFDVIDRYGGSISAEHGIGRVKQKAYLARADAVSLELAGLIKDALDPSHILSEGRILPARPVGGKRDR
jgi:FAD/FMN-containing dehydrogenase